MFEKLCVTAIRVHFHITSMSTKIRFCKKKKKKRKNYTLWLPSDLRLEATAPSPIQLCCLAT